LNFEFCGFQTREKPSLEHKLKIGGNFFLNN
jgi:hypothetical protein